MHHADHEPPPPCPYCEQDRIRDVGPDLEGMHWYRCEACLEKFYVRAVKLPTSNRRNG